jgi:hypothetical protein
MTIPLFIGESIPREIRNIMKSLEIGMPVRYKEFKGTIEFICDEYITVCINCKPTNDPYSKNKISKCCLLVYEQQWDDLEIEDTHFYDVKNYRGKTDDHPGNDMLPEVDKR